MTESQLTKYFRQQVEGTEQRTPLEDNPCTVDFRKLSSQKQNALTRKFGDMVEFEWNGSPPPEKCQMLRDAGIQLRGEGTEKLGVLDKFENGFNTPNRCVDCGLGRKAHEKGGIGHPFRTRKQARAKIGVEVSRADALLKDFQRQFGADAPQDAEGALDFLQRMGISRDEAVRAISASGGAIERIATEAIPEKQHWDNLQTSARQVLGSQLDIDPLPYDQLTPAEKGTLGVWWDENKARERAVSSPSDFDRSTGTKGKSFGGSKPTTVKKRFSLKFESFYNYDGAETLDSRAEERTAEEQSDDEVRSWWEQLAPQRRTGVIDGSSQLRFNELGPSAKQAVKLAFLRKPIPDSLMMKALNGEIKKPIGALSPKKISRLRSKMTPEEREDADEFHQYETVKAVGNEGQKFTVKQEGTMLPKGNYEVLSKKTDQAHSGPWGTFSITTVKNLETGERHEIPTGNAQLIYGIN